ncbi:SDR family NAD(P)-dependent oxidoreductase [Pontibacter sp. BAB1700]|uniref:SDR family NAD(P)-dependent oxidoreductase n=1 Tax=Pontibacter sp. BAB1700 TaxID=1144253 RepID=UPI00026BCE12|nr:SDR family oxidoreductase [Pontibacter sp. BAB1700]EJF09152.1 short-chain dehydrogenase [Pontibacter sp. BAB1700]
MEQVQYNFQDKVALVTGGTSGIGLATAQLLAKSGAQVIVTGRDKERGDTALATFPSSTLQPVYIQTDNSNNDTIFALFHEIQNRFGRLDIAVNNAAQESGIGKPLHEFEPHEYEDAMGANLRGVWLCMKQEIKLMLEQKPSGGAIVNVASVNGLGGAAMGSLYSAAKAAIIALAKSAAQEVATANIRINVLAPGAHRTPMLQKAFESQVNGDQTKVPEIEQMYLSYIPQKRIADPQEAAAAILWLCSDAASYITGQTTIVDGGMSAMLR